MRHNVYMTSPEPFLRWAGGKRQLLPVIHAALPQNFDLSVNRFFEPFVGGGAVMFSLHDFFGGRVDARNRIVINDVNEELVCTYRALRDSKSDVLRKLSKLKSRISEDDYYTMRSKRPKNDVERAVRLIYLNRTGFNGLYRVNSSGAFNVPWGKLKNPTVCNEELLKVDSEWLKNVTIRHGSYSSALEDAKIGDVVYLDPPYIPLSLTSSFSRYAKDDFLEISQYALAGVIRGLTARGVRVVFSNSYTPTTLKVYGDLLDLRVINVTRSISAKSSSRGMVQEVIGINFDISECCDPKTMQSLTPG